MPGGNARARGRAEARLRGDARAAGVAVAGLVLQGLPARRAVARRGSETAAALRAEFGIPLLARAVLRTGGKTQRPPPRRGARPPATTPSMGDMSGGGGRARAAGAGARQP